MDRADAYLTIPRDYADAVGGWRWSLGCDAVEDGDGGTLALVEQLAQVLEGVFAAPPAPPFVHVLHLLSRLKVRTPDHLLARLSDHYARLKPPGRNVGLLVAELCRGGPPFADPPAWAGLDLALKRRLLFGERHRPELEQAPGLRPREFVNAVAARLATLDDAALAHWLTNGCAPLAGRALAEAVETFPQRVAGFLELLRKRDRLVGAATLAPALDAALTFPPRRPRPDRLPQGGYADVTTHGEPERLLPSQFALEGDEFVRRFAERELLYFRREEPHKPTSPERWLVLDQGVRTWGPVRLGLTAAVVALLGKDPAKFGRVTLAVTSRPDVFDPADLAPAALADRLEASDLTANPGEALGRALGEPDTPDAPRDVVLMTHPRNLAEGDVRGTARLRGRNDRLFTLAVDDAGRAELGEWTPGGLVPIRTFRVDLAAGEAARVAGPAATATPAGDWAGDVEPVPFPFRAGLASDVVDQLGLDADGGWVVVIGRGGVVHAKSLHDGSPVEALPRAYRAGEVLKQVDGVLGVAGGVVVCGRMSAGGAGAHWAHVVPGGVAPAEVFAAAHYDFASRSVRLHLLSPAGAQPVWFSFPDLHGVAVRSVVGSPPTARGCAVDLATGGRFPVPFVDTGTGLTARARLAWDRAESGVPSPITVPAYATRPSGAPPWGPYLEVADDTFILHRSPRGWATLRPTREGEPLARGAYPFRAELAGDVLAVVMKDGRKPAKLYLLRGPDGAILSELGPANPSHAFKLSRDGGLIARQTGGRVVEVRHTAPGGGLVASVHSGGYHTRLDVRLDPARLRLRIGYNVHHFTLNEVPFRHECRDSRPDAPAAHQPWGYGTSDVVYDRERFIDPVKAGPWAAAFDRLGQVLLMTAEGKLVLAVTVRRELAAAVLPDGTRWGSAVLLGGPPHPSAAVRIGLALQAAAEGKEWKSSSG